jgi:hypothetical protein
MHRNLRKVVGTLALTAVAVLGVAACGSSDNGSSSGGTPASAGALEGSSASDDFCAVAKQLEQSMTRDSLSNPDKETFDKIDGFMSDLQAKVPAEIKDDLATVAKNLQDVKAFFAQYDFDLGKLSSAVQADPSLASKLQSLNSDEFNAASQKLDTYLQEKCGIQAGS